MTTHGSRSQSPRPGSAARSGAIALLLVFVAGGTAKSQDHGQHGLGATAHRVMTEADVPTLIVAGA